MIRDKLKGEAAPNLNLDEGGKSDRRFHDQ